ncbi:MAG: ABC transporter permease [Bacteroidota bacterium]|nr:ABC transporter permease [Bacteroidota bacterium]
MIKERIWVLTARKLAGEATEEEIKELEDLLRADPEIHFVIESLSKMWNAERINQTGEGSVKKLLERIKYHDQDIVSKEGRNKEANSFFKRNFMVRNHFKTAWRNIYLHKSYTTINVLGLALGICACIVVYLITSFELGFDKFHPGKERIYRIVGEMQRSSGEKEFLNSLIPDVAGFEKQIPGFEADAGFHLYGGTIKIPNGDKPAKKFDNRIEGSYSTSTIITWPQYFDVFHYDWLVGNATVLKEPYTVVLSENRAHKYFGNISLAEMIGKTVIYDDSLPVHVAGIIKDWNKNTDFGFTDFISISTATNSFLKNQIPTDDWSSLSPHRSMAFVKLAKGTTAAQINRRFETFIKEHVKLDNPGASLSMRLQALTDIHFTTDFHRGDDGDDFRKPYLPTLYALMGLALFILLIAAVNFINLSTAQSMQRAKEIGVRKVMGGNTTNIISQFLTETLVLTLLAVIVSVLLIKPVLSVFSEYIPPGITFHLFNTSTLTFLLIVTIITSLLAGFYPAKVLASYLPVWSLKGATVYKGGNGLKLRKGLIVFQFTISLIFIIGAIVMGNQIRFMRTTDKGFNSDAVLVINHWRDRDGKLKVFADNIKNIAGIDKVILQGNAPMGFAHGGQDFKYKGKNEIDLQASFDAANEDFISFYQMKLIAGRNITHSDSLKELVINETCSKAMGFARPADAINKFLYQGDKPYQVVGIVADFHEGTFHEAMRPVVIAKMPGREWSVAIKLSANEKQVGDVKEIIAHLEKQWKKIYPDEGFNYSFLNESITRLYDQETKTAWLMNMAMFITIFISCMGLFGLGMFSAQRRMKEIGIRKVLGASVANITAMLSKDFITLVLIALFIASPVAWYFMNQWLQDFAYRVSISGWVFIAAGAAAVFIALLTVSFQAVKTAIANPVKSLRTE